MYKLADYRDAYRNVAFRREGGVLECRFHSDGGSLLWNEDIHRDLGDAFYKIGQDPENRVVILTGTGADFCVALQPGSYQGGPGLPPIDFGAIYREGKDLLINLMRIPVPMIAAVNGPARFHSELALFCDIVLASDTALFQEQHLALGTVAGDGIHIAFMTAFGANRGRYLTLTAREVSAREALDWGAVAEVLPAEALAARAWELARSLAGRPQHVLRFTRELLARELLRELQDQLGYGLAMEGFAPSIDFRA